VIGVTLKDQFSDQYLEGCYINKKKRKKKEKETRRKFKEYRY